MRISQPFSHAMREISLERRMYQYRQDIYTRKLHSAPIAVIAATPDRSWMVTASENGHIFLLQQQVTIMEITTVEFKEVE